MLGLVYFETGEAVAALSEWIISKNIMPENNVATEYIATLQAEQAKLDMINQTIKKYNSALKCCRENNEDVAAIQLRKILNQNPKLIKGYHLLALIYIHKGEYEKARKILKKAAKIDKTNSTTLRFLKEVDFQTGTQTSLEPRRFGRRERTEEQREDERERVVSGGYGDYSADVPRDVYSGNDAEYRYWAGAWRTGCVVPDRACEYAAN